MAFDCCHPGGLHTGNTAADNCNLACYLAHIDGTVLLFFETGRIDRTAAVYITGAAQAKTIALDARPDILRMPITELVDKVRICKHSTAKQDEVALTRLNGFKRSLRCVGTNRHDGFVSKSFPISSGKIGHAAVTQVMGWKAPVFYIIAANVQIKSVNTQLIEITDDLSRFFFPTAIRNHVICNHAHHNGIVLSDSAAGCFVNLGNQTCLILEILRTIFVLASIPFLCHELIKQIPKMGVNLNCIHTRTFAGGRCNTIVLDGLMNFFPGQGARHLIGLIIDWVL